jgi:hypothetical protein
VTAQFKSHRFELDRQCQSGDRPNTGDCGKRWLTSLALFAVATLASISLIRVPKSSICRPQDGCRPFNGGQQRTNLAGPLDGDQAEFGGMAAECMTSRVL